MNPLLEYLVARSVPARLGPVPNGEEQAIGPSPGGDRRRAESLLGTRPGAVRPRLPGRYERLPGREPWSETLLPVEFEGERAARPGLDRPAAGEGLAGRAEEGQDLVPRVERLRPQSPGRYERLPGPEPWSEALPPVETEGKHAPWPGLRRPAADEMPAGRVDEERDRASRVEQQQDQPPASPTQAARGQPREPMLARNERGERQEVAPAPKTGAEVNLPSAPLPRAAAPPPPGRPPLIEPEVQPRRPPPSEGAQAPAREAPRPEEAIPAVWIQGQEATAEGTDQAPALRTAALGETISPIRASIPRPAGRPVPTPQVQVHIGRIEVRAVYAPPPAPTPPPRPGPVMSLDDYLKQRDGGS